jgi:5-methylcytosine-specific restriction protein A
MPVAPMRPCGQPGCSNVVVKGRCARHASEHEQQRPNYDVRRLYRTSRWRALRALVLSEQPLCDECAAEGHVEPGTQVDHTIPHRGDLALFWDRENLRNKCQTHHSRKTQRGE